MMYVNMAAKSMCEWVHAVNNFMDITQEIKLNKKTHVNGQTFKNCELDYPRKINITCRCNIKGGIARISL